MVREAAGPAASPRLRGPPPAKAAGAPTPPGTHRPPPPQWCEAKKVETDGLQVASFGRFGLRGLAASSSTTWRGDAVKMPFDSALRVIPLERCPFPDFVDGAFYDRQAPEMKMALQLLHERSKGPESDYAPYLAVLPREFDSPAGWAPDELGQLQYPHLEAQARAMGAAWGETHAELARTSPGAGVSRADLDWAIQCVQSRLFSGPYTGRSLRSRATLAGFVAVLAAGSVATGALEVSQGVNGFVSALLFNLIYDVLVSKQLKWYALLPLVDLANHRTGSPSEVSYQYFTDEFTLEVGSKCAPGEQLWIQYGEKTNDQLMLYYGFSEEDNPVDVYTFASLEGRLREQGVELTEARRALLARAELTEGISEAQLARNGFQKDTLQAVRVALASDAELGSQGAQVVAERGGAESERRLYEVLVACAEAELAGKATTAEKDGELLRSKSADVLGSRQRWAIEFRRQKKLLLQEGIRNMRKRAGL